MKILLAAVGIVLSTVGLFVASQTVLGGAIIIFAGTLCIASTMLIKERKK